MCKEGRARGKTRLQVIKYHQRSSCGEGPRPRHGLASLMGNFLVIIYRVKGDDKEII